VTVLQGIPSIQIKFGDQAIDDSLAAMLVRIDVTQAINRATCCEMHFVASLGNRLAVPVIGTTVYIESEEEDVCIFNGEITATRSRFVEDGQEQLVLRCYDILHRLRKTQHLRQFDNTSLAAMVESVLLEYNISLAFHATDVPLVMRYQWYQTDLEFLIENLQRYGMSCFYMNNQFHVFDTNGCDDAPLDLIQDQVLTLDIEQNVEPGCRSVNVLGFNPWRAESVEASADSGALMTSIDDVTNPASVGVTGERILSSQRCLNTQEAEILGKAMVQRRMSAEAIIEGRFIGQLQMQPGKAINLDSYLPKSRSSLILTQVTHRIDNNAGFTTEISTEPAELLETKKLISSLGIVCSVDDPEKMGRVKVQYPELGMLESQWLEVVQYAAGSGKGLVALPDVDDKVLVLFFNGEPVDGIVLGGLFGDSAAPDFGVVSGRVKQYTFATPEGQKIILDDKNSRVRIENEEGSFLELSPDTVHLFSRRNMTIEAPGRAMVIGADTIDFVQK